MLRALAGVLVSLVLAAPASAASRAVITGGPSGNVTATDATFTFDQSEHPIIQVTAPSFECRLDGGPFTACTSPVTYSGLGGGTHVFDVRMSGLLDDHTPASRSWVVEQQTVTAPPPLPPGRQPPPPKDNPAPRHAVDGCDYGAAEPGQASPGRLRAATICLFNRVRADHHLPPVHAKARLTRLAQSYAAMLATRKFFSHTSPGGLTFGQRVFASGYVRGRAWEVGEVLAWAPGAPTPHREVLAWLHSPPHRRIILTASYRDVGVGVTFAAPRRGVKRGATYVGEFGHVG